VAFRERTGVTYPFLVAEPPTFEAYPVAGFPTLVLVDKDGTVALVLVGGRKERLLHVAIDRRL
jgi:hypothetical protein